MSAEEIAETLSAMDQVEPVEMTEAERAEWEAQRQNRNRCEETRFTQHAENLRRAWE